LVDQNTFGLVFVGSDHLILEDSNTSPIFLGQQDSVDYYAHDISNWSPAQPTEQVETFLDERTEHHPAMPDHERFCDLRIIMTQLSPQDGELAATAKSLFAWHVSHRFCAACGEPSISAQAGWQRNCPACETSHFPRTDPVVIMLVTNGNKTLLGRGPNWPEGMYSCLAGFLEPGETIEAAVAREVKEETDVDVGQVSYVTCQPWPYPSSLMIGCHASALTTKIKIDTNELDDAIWVSKETLIKAYAGSNVGISPARSGSIAGFLIRNWVDGTLGK